MCEHNASDADLDIEVQGGSYVEWAAVHQIYGYHVPPLHLPLSSISSLSLLRRSSSVYSRETNEDEQAHAEVSKEPDRYDASAWQRKTSAAQENPSSADTLVENEGDVAKESRAVRGRLTGSIWKAHSGAPSVENASRQAAGERYQSVFREFLEDVMLDGTPKRT